MENPNYKNKNIEKKFFKDNLLESGNNLIELKDREVKIIRKIEEQFFTSILSIDDMNRFLKK